MRVLSTISKIGLTYVRLPKEQENERSSFEVLNSCFNENESQIWWIFRSMVTTDRESRKERPRTILILSVTAWFDQKNHSSPDCQHLGFMWPIKQRLLMALHQRKEPISARHTLLNCYSPASNISPALSITICCGISSPQNRLDSLLFGLLSHVKQNPADASYLANYICNQQE